MVRLSKVSSLPPKFIMMSIMGRNRKIVFTCTREIPGHLLAECPEDLKEIMTRALLRQPQIVISKAPQSNNVEKAKATTAVEDETEKMVTEETSPATIESEQTETCNSGEPTKKTTTEEDTPRSPNKSKVNAHQTEEEDIPRSPQSRLRGGRSSSSVRSRSPLGERNDSSEGSCDSGDDVYDTPISRKLMPKSRIPTKAGASYQEIMEKRRRDNSRVCGKKDTTSSPESKEPLFVARSPLNLNIRETEGRTEELKAALQVFNINEDGFVTCTNQKYTKSLDLHSLIMYLSDIFTLKYIESDKLSSHNEILMSCLQLGKCKIRNGDAHMISSILKKTKAAIEKHLVDDTERDQFVQRYIKFKKKNRKKHKL